MKISKLRVNKRNPQKIDIFADSEFAGTISLEILARYALYQDKEIARDLLVEILVAEQVAYYKALIIELTAGRPRSEKEIKDYIYKRRGRRFPGQQYELQGLYRELKDRIDNTDVVPGLISELKQKGYIDDQNFAEWWISNRNSFRGRSQAELRRELQKKGIASEIISQKLQIPGQKVTEREILQELLVKKLHLLAGKKLTGKQKKQKVIEYLLRKGFLWDDIKPQLENSGFKMN